jgi:hypothetical protein
MISYLNALFLHTRISSIVTRLLFCALFVSLAQPMGIAGAKNPAGAAGGSTGVRLRVYVYDADQNTPLELVRVILRHGKKAVVSGVTDPKGLALFVNLEAGDYKITAHDVEYTDRTDSITVDAEHTVDSIGLHSLSQTEVEVSADREIATSDINLKTDNQVFESETYHAPPTTGMTNLIQQNVAGAAKAPTGEVHIRGQHGEYTYYVDGLPIPLGVFGGLNEVVDSKIIDRATFLTGGFPAEYGGQMAAVVDLQNRVPAGSFHLDASTYGGSYLVFNGTKPLSPGAAVPLGSSSSAPGDTLGGRVGPFRALNSNGQSLSLSDHVGSLGFFLSGSRQETDRRVDDPVATLYNDHGLDQFLYGKFDYILTDKDYVTMNLSWGNTDNEVPFDPAEVGFAPDYQQARNSFQTLSYYHTISSETDQESNLFIGAVARQGGLQFYPSPESPVNFQFPGDTTNYALTEDRSFSSIGTRIKYDVRLSHEWQFAMGLTFTNTTGAENFTSRDSLERTGPSVLSDYSGSEFGVFGQTEWHPIEWTRLDAGLRYDQQITPDAPLTSQVSPRFRWNFFPDETNTIYFYYGRLFMPNNIEGLRLLGTSVAALPERDNMYETSYLHVFDYGLTSKFAFFYKYASPGVDDETLGSSSVKTPVNIDVVRTTGIEMALTYTNPTTPFSGYLNAAITHAYGSGALTAGFLPITTDGFATDLDHDQRLSIVGSLNYQPEDWFVNFTTTYGSGLTNGDPSNSPYGTGLFDFNSAAHVPGYILFDVGGGHTFPLGGEQKLEGSIYVSNIFDHDYLLRGAYFSAAAFGERRNVVFKLSYHI